MKKYEDLRKASVADVKEFTFRACIGWRKMFVKAQEVIDELCGVCADSIPDDLYLKCLKIRDLHELPKRYWKGVKDDRGNS